MQQDVQQKSAGGETQSASWEARKKSPSVESEHLVPHKVADSYRHQNKKSRKSVYTSHGNPSLHAAESKKLSSENAQDNLNVKGVTQIDVDVVDQSQLTYMPKLNKQQNNKLAVESGDNVQGPKEENLGLKSFTKNNINDIFRIEEMKSGLNDLSIQQETREVHLDAHKTSYQNLDQKPNRD